MTTIIDANNYIRQWLESEQNNSSAPRAVLNAFINRTDTPIFVWDGPNSLAARRAIYPEYKATRNKPQAGIYESFEIIRGILQLCPVVQIRVPGYEADDVIATITQPGDEVLSTDRDFHQIEGITLPFARALEVPAHMVRSYKTLVGDPSDNIPGIKGFGAKSWTEAHHHWLVAIMAGEEPPAVEFPKRCKVDVEELRVFWQVVGFLDVPLEDIEKGMVVGQKNFAAADLFLKEFMQ